MITKESVVATVGQFAGMSLMWCLRQHSWQCANTD